MQSVSTQQDADIGVVGLGVMGSNLVLNLDDHGFVVAVFNRTTRKVDDFLVGPAAGTGVIGTHTLDELVAALRTPRKILLMIPAGPPVDAVVDALLPLLAPGDIVLDGGNSLFTDTIERTRRVEAAGLRYVGVGISGGADGARNGPSIMPGGSASAWRDVRGILQPIAASVNGVPCCDWVGSDGAGHYVKMVHNGIEYGDMQVLAEAYDIMHRGLGMSHAEMHDVYADWDHGPLDSYLVEITADIMASRDKDGSPLLEKVLDAAGQKGTGKWTVASSMELGQPTSLAAEAVYARIVSALYDRRAVAADRLDGPDARINEPRDKVVADLHDAVYASKIVAYAQGFMLLDAAADEHRWELNFAAIAAMWRGGCIIRSRFLAELMEVFATHPGEPDILVSDFFGTAVQRAQDGWRRTVARAAAAGIPVPAYGAALAFFDAYRSVRVPANLIQAQRDYFGAHTFERVDRARGEWFTGGWHRSTGPDEV
jgi:6-phosphogluconate dehydrogenase